MLTGAVAASCSLLVDTRDLAGGKETPDAAGVDSGPVPDVATSDGNTEAATCGPEIDLTRDPRNCGRCGHDCLGGSCVDSRCQPTLFQSENDQPVGLATDGSDLFWTTFNGHVRATCLDGRGAVREVAKIGAQGGYLDLDATFVYAATYGDNRIVRVPKAGGSVETIMTCEGACLGLVVAGGGVYFTDRGPQALRRVGPDGGTTIAAGLSAPEDVSADDTTFYIANEGANAIVKVPRAGGSATDPLVITDPVAVAVDGQEMWVVSQAPGIIYRRPLAGGALDAVATGQRGPAGILLTPSAAYWACIEDRRIVRLAR